MLTLRTTARSLVDLFNAVSPATREELGLVYQPVAGGTLLAATSLKHLMLNRLIGAAVSGIDEAVAVYQRLGVPSYLLTFDEEVFDEALAGGARHGLGRFRRPWATLLRPIESRSPPPEVILPDGISIRQACARDAPGVGALLCSAFQLPPQAAPVFAAAVERPRWVVYVAESGTQLAGVGLLFMDAGIAHLAGGATAPAYQRRGIQRALVATRVRWAASQGATHIYSETGVAMPGEPNPSWGNLVRAGLQPIDKREHLCPAGASWAG